MISCRHRHHKLAPSFRLVALLFCTMLMLSCRDKHPLLWRSCQSFALLRPTSVTKRRSATSLRPCAPFALGISHASSSHFQTRLLYWQQPGQRSNRQGRLLSLRAVPDEDNLVQEETAFKEEDDTTSSLATVSSRDTILMDLNPSQIEAVTQPLQAISRVVAGPGSGKTRVLTCRIAYLLQEDPQARVLGVTFTRKASGEMQKRLAALLTTAATSTTTSLDVESVFDQDTVDETLEGLVSPVGLDRVTLGTFHSVCAKILRWNGDLLSSLPTVVQDMANSINTTNLDSNFAIVDQGEQLRVLKDCLSQADIDLKQYSADLKPVSILNAIGQAKSKISKGEDPFTKDNRNKKPPTPTERIVAKVYAPYRQKLLASNTVDFDDLIYMTRELLMEEEEIREHLQRRWTHVLIDEFQDTSRTQMDLVKLLTGESLFVVGDADQSIYSWRGAHAGSLSDFAEEYNHFPGGVSTTYLMENYRSTSNIVKAAQKVISSSNKATGADKLRQDMKPKRGSGPPPRVIACKDDRKEADFVVKAVKDKVDSGEYGTDYSVAFIYRTNAQSRALEEACVQYNLPYVIFGSATSFYKRQEIKDCLCYLRFLHNGWDQSSMLRAMTTPRRGMGDRLIAEFGELCDAINENETEAAQLTSSPLTVLLSLNDIQENPEIAALVNTHLSTRPRKLLTEFAGQLHRIQNMAMTGTVEQLLSSVIEEFEILPHLDKISKSKAEFDERQANVQELQKAAGRYAKDGPALVVEQSDDPDAEPSQSPLGTFLDDVALVTDLAESSGSGDERFVANLMTIHASKGMEFDTVFVVGVEDGTLPTNQALQEGEGSVVYEEEKRLCYVAMTRAKTELLLTWRREVPIFTSEGIRTVDKNRSRFLDVLVGKKSSEGAPARKQKATTSRRQPFQDTYQRGQSPQRGMSHASERPTRSARPQATRWTTHEPRVIARKPVSFEGTNGVYGQNNSPLAGALRPPTKARQTTPRPPTQPSQTTPRPLTKPSQATPRTSTRQPTQARSLSSAKPTLRGAFAPNTSRSNESARPSVPIAPVTRTRSAVAPKPATHVPTTKARNVPREMPIRPPVAARPATHVPPVNPRTTSPTNGGVARDPSPAIGGSLRASSPEKVTSDTSRATYKQQTETKMDSTWFFPIGSQVKHRHHGRGVVLPPPLNASDDMLVSVQFERTGERKDFSATGTDISPVVA